MLEVWWVCKDLHLGPRWYVQRVQHVTRSAEPV